VSRERRFGFIGRGTYSLAQSERLTRVPRDTIRRWTQGYSYPYRGERRSSPPLIATDTPKVDGIPVLSFADIMEVRFLDAFRRHGVSPRAIRVASFRAQELLGRPRPFSTKIFKTDGRTIMAELVRGTGDPMLLDLVRDQFQFSKIVGPYLYFGIQFNDLKEPQRWWPLGEDRGVVVDPNRSFGAPIVNDTGIQTTILFAGFKAEGSLDFVSEWYRVPISAVEDAIEFEESLAA
jgi:uncharacterized protein (DUF433 family)